jgi:hypothetical protein
VELLRGRTNRVRSLRFVPTARTRIRRGRRSGPSADGAGPLGTADVAGATGGNAAIQNAH